MPPDRARSEGCISDLRLSEPPRTRKPARPQGPPKDLLRLPYALPLSVMFRLDKIARYTDESLVTYGLGSIPVTATWGEGPFAHLLTVERTPVDVWAVVELEELLFCTRRNNIGVVSFKGNLLRQSDSSRMVNLLRRSNPKTRASDVETPWLFRASTHFPAKDTVFRRMFDGTTALRAQERMPTVAINEFLPGDIVLVESQCVRATDDMWTTWTVSFELTAITLLHAVPRTQHGVPNTFHGSM